MLNLNKLWMFISAIIRTTLLNYTRSVRTYHNRKYRSHITDTQPAFSLSKCQAYNFFPREPGGQLNYFSWWPCCVSWFLRARSGRLFESLGVIQFSILHRSLSLYCCLVTFAMVDLSHIFVSHNGSVFTWVEFVDSKVVGAVTITLHHA